MRITQETSSYNHRRMGRPWIAKVDFSETTKGNFIWGSWTGDHYNGGEGVLSIDTHIGDIVAMGQKDNRQPRNSAPDFYEVVAGPNGAELLKIGDKGAAYKYYLEHKDAAQDQDALKAERNTLVNRIAEIDELLNN